MVDERRISDAEAGAQTPTIRERLIRSMVLSATEGMVAVGVDGTLLVANHAAGKGDSRNAIAIEAIGAVLDASMGRVRRILAAFARQGVAAAAPARQP